jgi:tetratricopeptide (TPR) repeat protein
MKVPNLQKMALADGILAERIPDENRIAVWLPRDRADGFQYWERITNVARARITVEDGICATAALAIPARHRVGGLFGKLLRPFQRNGEPGWVLPNGQAAEQCGQRQTDLLLVWPQEEGAPLNEGQLKSRWPRCQKLQKIGGNLFLLKGVEPPVEASEDPELRQLQRCPQQFAEKLLELARQSGDRRKEVSALTDLGLVLMQTPGQAGKALSLVEEALTIARELGERSRESDVLMSLGLVCLSAGQPQRAVQILEPELVYARQTNNRFAEKNILERLGLAYSQLGSPPKALSYFEQALAVTRAVGDRKQEGDLLWHIAIQQADLGRRDQALASGQAAVDLLTRTGKPQAEWFAEHLEKFRRGDAGLGSPEADPAGQATFVDGSIMAGSWLSQSPAQQSNGPGFLRMAFTAAKSMSKFFGTGFRTTPPEMAQKRLRTCEMCEHHTGLRCRLCGCFTGIKARMSHEECPIGKWPG